MILGLRELFRKLAAVIVQFVFRSCHGYYFSIAIVGRLASIQGCSVLLLLNLWGCVPRLLVQCVTVMPRSPLVRDVSLVGFR